ncbi:MAG: hypothetical protein GY943_27340 [Chloroflexi bacterium]|nr:hypothetical protein [Chloroflexota bacterium]
MKLESSPSLEDFADSVPEPPPDRTGRNKVIRIIIAILSLIILGLLVTTIIQSDTVQQLLRKGSFSGFAVDANENPVQVELFVFGTDIELFSDENGYFQVNNVPIGEQSVIIAVDLVAIEVNLLIEANKNSDLGTVTIPTDIQID